MNKAILEIIENTPGKLTLAIQIGQSDVANEALLPAIEAIMEEFETTVPKADRPLLSELIQTNKSNI